MRAQHPALWMAHTQSTQIDGALRKGIRQTQPLAVAL